MNITEDKDLVVQNDTIQGLKRLLADEFILMNKIASCLMDNSSPFYNSSNTALQKIHDIVKANSETISAQLKQLTKSLLLSISDILQNTSLKKNISFKNKAAVVHTLQSDNSTILQALVAMDKEVAGKLTTAHHQVEDHLQLMVKDMMN